MVPGCRSIGKFEPGAPKVTEMVDRCRDELVAILGEDVRDDIAVEVVPTSTGLDIRAQWIPGQ